MSLNLVKWFDIIIGVELDARRELDNIAVIGLILIVYGKLIHCMLTRSKVINEKVLMHQPKK